MQKFLFYNQDKKMSIFLHFLNSLSQYLNAYLKKIDYNF